MRRRPWAASSAAHLLSLARHNTARAKSARGVSRHERHRDRKDRARDGATTSTRRRPSIRTGQADVRRWRPHRAGRQGNGDAAAASGKGSCSFPAISPIGKRCRLRPTSSDTKAPLVYRPPNNPSSIAGFASACDLGPRAYQQGRAGNAADLHAAARTRQIDPDARRSKDVGSVPAPFFGRDAMTTRAPASLALQLGATLCRLRRRASAGLFPMKIYPPIIHPERRLSGDVLALTGRSTKPSRPWCGRTPRNGFGFTAAGPARATRSSRTINETVSPWGFRRARGTRRVELERNQQRPQMGCAGRWPRPVLLTKTIYRRARSCRAHPACS